MLPLLGSLLLESANQPSVFVVVRYHFQNASFERVQMWFWGASASYCICVRRKECCSEVEDIFIALKEILSQGYV